MRKLAFGTIFALASAALVLMSAPLHAFPLCANCTCNSSCNQRCSIDWPGGGTNDICANWLCVGQCFNSRGTTDSTQFESDLFATSLQTQQECQSQAQSESRRLSVDRPTTELLIRTGESVPLEASDSTRP